MPAPFVLAGAGSLLARLAAAIGGRAALKAGVSMATKQGAKRAARSAATAGGRGATATAGATARAAATSAARSVAQPRKAGLLRRTGKAFASGFHPETLASQLGPMALFTLPFLMMNSGGDSSPFDEMAEAENKPSKPNLYYR